MTNSTIKRKTRSDKFPLTLHKTGQFCKKIKGKIYYFGKDKKVALQRYLNQASELHSGRDSIHCSSEPKITIFILCNLYLEYQKARFQIGELTAKYYDDQVKGLRIFVRFLGRHRQLDEISTLELQNYKKKLQKTYPSPHRVNLNIAIMKAMFHWAKKNDVLQNIPNIDAVSKLKIPQAKKPTFTTKEIQKLIDCSNVQMKAMILLGLNCGFGCIDCAELRWDNIDFQNKRVNFPRSKTGIGRDLTLWPETINALKNISKTGELVFCTEVPNRWRTLGERL